MALGRVRGGFYVLSRGCQGFRLAPRGGVGGRVLVLVRVLRLLVVGAVQAIAEAGLDGVVGQVRREQRRDVFAGEAAADLGDDLRLTLPAEGSRDLGDLDYQHLALLGQLEQAAG